MITNGMDLWVAQPIKDMLDTKVIHGSVSHGLGEAGYDIRIKQSVRFWKSEGISKLRVDSWNELGHPTTKTENGRFALASAIEEFEMPDWLVGVVHDKSSWARRGLSVFNTVIEPGWHGFLTLELVYHGEGELFIPAGSGIAQVLFHQTTQRASYSGKYQNQEDQPVPARG